MKNAIYICAILLSLTTFGKGFTPEMVMRNGLSDEQIDSVFAARTNAELRLTRQHWMNLQYRLHRFDNMKGWLNMGIEGKLGDEILRVTDTNKVLVAINSYLYGKVDSLSNAVENLYISLTNQVAITEATERARQLAEQGKVFAEAERDKAVERLTRVRADIQAKRDEYQEKYNKGTVITKPIYKAIIAVFDVLLKIIDGN